MLKTVLKAFIKLFITIVVVRLAILALGVNLTTGTPFTSKSPHDQSGSTLSDFREIGRQGLELITVLLDR